MIPMQKSLLIRLMDRLSQQEVIQLSEYIAKNELKDTILLMKSRYTSDTVMEYIESWIRVGGFPFKHHIGDDKSRKKHLFVMQHDMGERWSLYFVELFRFAFEETGIKIDLQHTANTISFEAEY
jgi:hypothetical protein